MISAGPELRHPVDGPGGQHPAQPVTRSDRLATRAVVVVLLIGFYYLSYRYPLQINSSDTSPVYSDTPAVLQVGKYLLLAAAAAVVVLLAWPAARSRPASGRGASPVVCLLLVLLCAFALGKGVLVGDQDLQTVGLVLAVGAVLAPLALRWSLDVEAVTRVVVVFAVVVVVVEAVQVLLFATTGRLPALAYANSISVRFGSLLDDPNGLALLVALLLPVVWVRWRGRPAARALVGGGLVASLLLTQSLTGVATVAGTLVLVSAVALRRSPARLVALVWGAAAAAVAVAAVLLSSPLFSELLETKSGSVEDHAQSFEALTDLRLADLLGVSADTSFYEAAYVSLLHKGGVLLALAWVALGVFSARRLLGAALRTPGPGSALFWGWGTYQAAFLVAAANMQFFAVYPNNLVFVLGVVVALFCEPGRAPGRVEDTAGDTADGTAGGTARLAVGAGA
ncbi:hypothetical protein [Quadrisphaera sp. KR29]|uniref:hypothetical protein n=1 Tax=Quadrisphaera sp. KR29 TaxID=3461391 RepID=UPI004043A750